MQMSFADLFQELLGAPSKTLDPENVRKGTQSLRDVRKQSEDDDMLKGPPQCKVRVVGDPEIIDRYGRSFHFYGPALLVNIDDNGMVRSLEFMGVCSDDDYISEVWHLNVMTGKYKYRNLSHMQGQSTFGISCHHGGKPYDEPQFQAGQETWVSEVGPNAVPSQTFLQKFRPTSETFFVDCRSGVFVRGPQYSLLKAAMLNPAKLVKSLFASCSMDAGVWMQRAAEISRESNGRARARPCREMDAIQVAQLVYGLTACKNKRCLTQVIG